MKNEIIVNDKNKEKIQSVLDEVQKRAKVRTITVDDIFDTIKNIEDTLGIPKKHMNGLYYEVDLHAEKLPHAYIKKGFAESTQFYLHYEKNRWSVSDICRTYLNRRNTKIYCYRFPDEVKNAIIKKYTSF